MNTNDKKRSAGEKTSAESISESDVNREDKKQTSFVGELGGKVMTDIKEPAVDDETANEEKAEAENGIEKVTIVKKRKGEEKKKGNFTKLNINDLANMTISELSSFAREFNIEGASRMKKQDLFMFLLPKYDCSGSRQGIRYQDRSALQRRTSGSLPS